MNTTPLIVLVEMRDRVSGPSKKIETSIKGVQRAAEQATKNLQKMGDVKTPRLTSLLTELQEIAKREQQIKRELAEMQKIGNTARVSTLLKESIQLQEKFKQLRTEAAQLAAPIHRGTAKMIEMSKSATQAAKNFQLIHSAASGSLGVMGRLTMMANRLRVAIGGAMNFFMGISMLLGGLTFGEFAKKSIEYAKKMEEQTVRYKASFKELGLSEKEATKAAELYSKALREMPIPTEKISGMTRPFIMSYAKEYGRVPTPKEFEKAEVPLTLLYTAATKAKVSETDITTAMKYLFASKIEKKEEGYLERFLRRLGPSWTGEEIREILKIKDPIARLDKISEKLAKSGYTRDYYGTISVKWELLKRQFEARMLEFGVKILPIIEKLLDLFKQVDDATGGGLTNFIVILAVISSIAMLIMPITIGIGGWVIPVALVAAFLISILSSSGILQKIFDFFSSVWNTIHEHLKGFGDTFAKVVATAATLAPVIAGIVGVLAVMRKFSLGPFSETGAFTRFGAMARRAGGAVRSVANTAADALSGAGGRLSGLGSRIGGVFGRLRGLPSVLSGLPGRLSGLTRIGGIVGGIGSKIAGVGSSIMGIFSGLAPILMNPITILIIIAVIIIIILWRTGMLGKIVKALGDAWKAFSSAVMSALKPVADFIIKLIDGAKKLWDWLMKSLGLKKKTPEEKKREEEEKKKKKRMEEEKTKKEDRAAMATLKGAPKPVKDLVSGLLKIGPLRPIILGLVKNFQLLRTVLSPLARIARSILGSSLNFILKISRQILEVVRGGLVKYFRSWMNILRAAGSIIMGVFGPAINFVRPLLQKVWDIISQIWNTFKNLVSTLMKGAETIKGVFKKIWDAAMKFLQPVADILGAVGGFIGSIIGGGGPKGKGKEGNVNASTKSPFTLSYAGAGSWHIRFPDLDPRNLSMFREVAGRFGKLKTGGAAAARRTVLVEGSRTEMYNYYVGRGAFEITVKDMSPSEAKRVLVTALESITAKRRAFPL